MDLQYRHLGKELVVVHRPHRCGVDPGVLLHTAPPRKGVLS